MRNYLDGRLTIHVGDCLDRLREMPDESVDCCVTSPPYFGLRDYGHEGQIGLEPTPAEFVAKLVAVFREVRRVLKPEGTCWVNLGDSYNAYNGNRGASVGQANGHHHEIMPALGQGTGLVVKSLKNKDLIGIPWMVAFALRNDGWYLRQEVIWHKPNPMPESVRDRCTKAHEHVFLLTKNARYFYDAEAIKEPADLSRAGKIERSFSTSDSISSLRQDVGREVLRGETRNKRSVWSVSTMPFGEAHFATFPPALVEPMILAGCPNGGVVLDPFGGAGTTALVALRHGRRAVLIELNPEYADMAAKRITTEWRSPLPPKQVDLGPLFSLMEPAE